MYSFQTRKKQKGGWLIYLIGNNVIYPKINQKHKIRLIQMSPTVSIKSHVHTHSGNGLQLSI